VFVLLLRSGQRLTRSDWKRLWSLGRSGRPAARCCFTLGIAFVPATYAALMLMTGPLWTAVLEWVF
jgi:drug/metabolite transporter (DMT)-like permease